MPKDNHSLLQLYLDGPKNNFFSFFISKEIKSFKFNETYLINGLPPTKGQIFKNTDLANTLRIISKEGRSGFYEGKVAKIISELLLNKVVFYHMRI